MADINSSILSASPLTPGEFANAAVNFIKQNAVKTAPIDTVISDNYIEDLEIMTDILFENVGGQELINIARNDIVNGQKISYNIIKNLAEIQQQYNPLNILGLQGSSDEIFRNFSINLNEKIPVVGNGTGGSNVYFDSSGDLTIEFVNLNSDEQIEVQISLSGTIYEAYLGEATSW